MSCSNCGSQLDGIERFCRKCGRDVGNTLAQNNPVSVQAISLKDADDLTGNGIGSVIMGDGFLIVALILGATHTAISSLLWLLLIIPAFIFFGKGFADVLKARQIRRRLKELPATAVIQAPTTSSSFAEIVSRTSGQIGAGPSVTERTTRELK